MTGDLESVMSLMGERGRYQRVMHLLLSLTYIVLVFNYVSMSFLGMRVPHTCEAWGQRGAQEDGAAYTRTAVWNSSTPDSRASTALSPVVVNISSGQCSSTLSYEDGRNETLECSTAGQWTYQPKRGLHTLISEFDLVCSDDHLASLATTIFFSGVMVGGLIFGDLADRFGRLPVLLTTIYCSLVVGVVTAFSVNYIMFVIMRFIAGFFVQGMQTAAYTMVMELFVTKHRPFAGAITESFFGIAVVLLAGLAYFFRDWRHLQVALTTPVVVLLVHTCCASESVRWLLTKGQYDRAEGISRKICRLNKLPFPEDEWRRFVAKSEQIQRLAPEKKQYTALHLIKTAEIRKRSLLLFFIWLATVAGYYGLIFKMSTFKADIYLSFLVSGSMEFVCYILSMPVMTRFGRRLPIIVCYALAASMCIAAGIINDIIPEQTVLISGLAIVGRCSIAMGFAILFVFTSELYPTVIRNIGMGSCFFWGRLGGVIVPQVIQFSKSILGVDAIIVLGALATGATICFTFLPETRARTMPETIRDVEGWKTAQDTDQGQGHPTETDQNERDGTESIPLTVAA